MILRAPDHEEIALVLIGKLILHLPYQFASIQVDDFKIGVPVHAERLASTQKMMHNVDRKTGVKWPDMNSVGIYLGIQDQEVPPWPFFLVTNQVSSIPAGPKTLFDNKPEMIEQGLLVASASKRIVLFPSERYKHFLQNTPLGQAYFNGCPVPSSVQKLQRLCIVRRKRGIVNSILGRCTTLCNSGWFEPFSISSGFSHCPSAYLLFLLPPWEHVSGQCLKPASLALRNIQTPCKMLRSRLSSNLPEVRTTT